MPHINLDEFEIAPDVIDLVPLELARRHKLIPVNRVGASLIVAMSDPSDIFAIDAIRDHTGCHVEVVIALEAELDRAIRRCYIAGSNPDSSGESA